eukprot:CAMPEP_0172721424 /NCGR_PEP_ID=MMETSP1074-20121228/79089_1 /TAXON_ID=2916 /ORGANISM="Ceratium fusus, Strain PA161109" /LENGTH=106 /DNA_ID=CAMNT_0013547167 /DNA_START=74 /DNA_END=391 /DNA_ORIENTATION=-
MAQCSSLLRLCVMAACLFTVLAGESSRQTSVEIGPDGMLVDERTDTLIEEFDDVGFFQAQVNKKGDVAGMKASDQSGGSFFEGVAAASAASSPEEDFLQTMDPIFL